MQPDVVHIPCLYAPIRIKKKRTGKVIKNGVTATITKELVRKFLNYYTHSSDIDLYLYKK